MTNKKYRKGYRFENKIKERFENEGYFVIRSAGSHGIADLVVFPPIYKLNLMNKNFRCFPILIQCKAVKKKTFKKECKELIRVALRYGCGAKLISKDKEIDLVR